MAWTSTALTVASRKMPTLRKTSVNHGPLISSMVLGCAKVYSPGVCAFQAAFCLAPPGDPLNANAPATSFVMGAWPTKLGLHLTLKGLEDHCIVTKASFGQ